MPGTPSRSQGISKPSGENSARDRPHTRPHTLIRSQLTSKSQTLCGNTTTGPLFCQQGLLEKTSQTRAMVNLQGLQMCPCQPGYSPSPGPGSSPAGPSGYPSQGQTSSSSLILQRYNPMQEGQHRFRSQAVATCRALAVPGLCTIALQPAASFLAVRLSSSQQDLHSSAALPSAPFPAAKASPPCQVEDF